jgi:hypothetical protein
LYPQLAFPKNPNGVYLMKGGGPEVWRTFGVPSRWRTSQGLIQGKRCGITENIEAAARTREGRGNDVEAIAESINPSATAVGDTASTRG